MDISTQTLHPVLVEALLAAVLDPHTCIWGFSAILLCRSLELRQLGGDRRWTEIIKVCPQGHSFIGPRAIPALSWL